MVWSLSPGRCRHTGEIDRAVKVAEKALELSGGSQFYLSVLGAAYAAAGQTERCARRSGSVDADVGAQLRLALSPRA